VEEFTVTLKTLTPLWTGDAWRRNQEIKPQSIMGALRFWFEVYCHAVGIEVKEYNKENVNYKEFRKKLEEKIRQNSDRELFELEDEVLAEMRISLPSRIFGCTGWRGRVFIKGIQPIENYCFGNYLNLPEVIYKDKNNSSADWQVCKRKEVNDLKKKNKNKNLHFWYFSIPYFGGKFEVTFQVKKEIKDTILVPLLNFIQYYGFIGGRNNLGYGRVKIEENLTNEVFKFSQNERLSDKSINEAIEEVNGFDELLEAQNKKIKLWKKEKNANSFSFQGVIKELIAFKAKERLKISNNEERHYIFGSTKRDKYNNIQGPNATKIIPWINPKNDGNYEYGFISLVGLQYFGERNEKK